MLPSTTERAVRGEVSETASRPCLHAHPPATPSSFYRDRVALLLAIGALFVALGIAARVSGAWLPLRWDLPIQRAVEAHRTAGLTRSFLAVSRLGSTVVVLAASAGLAIVAWRRCRSVGVAILLAALSRPLLEFLLKAFIGRERPDLDQLVNGRGPSFPSGHVLAAIALYGLVPLVVGLYTRSRVLWWASAAASGAVIVAVAASRVYLGVHWFTDVVASLLLGSFFLLGTEALVANLHRTSGCTKRDS